MKPDWCLPLVVTAALGLSMIATAGAQSTDELAELVLARDVAKAAGELQAAQTTAIEIVQLVSTQHGEAAVQLAQPLLELARIHRALGNSQEAERTYLRVLDILQTNQGKTGPDLVTPYRELAQSFMDAGRFGDALSTLEQARSISRRNFGLFNMAQVQLFDDLTQAYLGLDDTAKAQQMQEEKVILAVRNFGADDPQVAPYREQLADYYQRSRLKVASREEHRKALEIHANQVPPDTAGQLRALSNIMRLNLVLLGDQDEHVRIARLLEEGDIGPVQRAETLALLGDFYLVRVKDRSQAERYWAQAYRLAQSLPAEDTRDLTFKEPVMLDFVPPLNSVDQRTSRRKRVAWGQLVALFSVDADGHAANIRVEMSEPDRRLAKRYEERIAATRFRPRLIDSVPVDTPRVRLTHAYRYFVD